MNVSNQISSSAPFKISNPKKELGCKRGQRWRKGREGAYD